MNHTTVIGPKYFADLRGAARLDREQPDQDDDRERDDELLERRRDELQAFDGRQHRDGRRDDGVAVEERGAGDAEPKDQRRVVRFATDWPSAISANMPPSPLLSARSSMMTYLSVTIEHQRPDDQRQHAEHGFAADKPSPRAAMTASRNAYSGLVPMSP